MTTAEQIVKYIQTNRVSTTEIADCLGKTGAIEGVKAIVPGIFSAGVVRYIYGFHESNWPIHEQARDVQPGEIVVIDGIDVRNRALIGELVTKFILLYKMAAGIVLLGNARDANDLIKNRYHVWSRGVSPVGCFNREVTLDEGIRSAVETNREYYHNAIAVCDDTGVVVIPKDKITTDFVSKLEYIEKQEDIWFNCIDFKKWDTFDTVCLKKYLHQTDDYFDLEV